MRYRSLLLLLPFLVLAACQLTPARDENSPSYAPPAGSRLVLKQALTIPAETAGVFIQAGRATTSHEVNEFHPHCRLEVNDRRETTQTVNPDEFRVRRVRRDIWMVSNPPYGLLAGLDGGPSISIFRTMFDLESPRQPLVRTLLCAHRGHPALDNHLSIRDIRTALGEVMSLELPAADAR